MTPEQPHPTAIAAGDHKGYMEFAIEVAQRSPPAPNKFCVGAVLVDGGKNEILSTGYSLELPDDNPADPGKTHAEQCCFIKVAKKHNLPEERLCEVLPTNTVLYTTMEPCNKRLSGNRPCVDRILRLKDSIKVVYIGIKEPENFIEQSVLKIGRERMANEGVKVVFVEGLEDRIMEVSLAGH
ncbi:DRAP deaminase [Halenospora varia]|nr:DRAP deaminase [Halenospora varia]